MTMSRAPVFPVEEKVRVVLSILAGELSVAEAARRAKVSEQSVGNCRFQFPTDCSETFARRAASATDNSPAKIDRTTRTFSSTGNTGALDMVIRLLQQVTTRNQRALPQSLTRDSTTQGRLIEVFFGILTRQAIRRGTFTSVADLQAAIGTYIDAWNQRCEPFRWVKDADTILAKATRPKPTNTQDTSVTRH